MINFDPVSMSSIELLAGQKGFPCCFVVVMLEGIRYKHNEGDEFVCYCDKLPDKDTPFNHNGKRLTVISSHVDSQPIEFVTLKVSDGGWMAVPVVRLSRPA